MHIHSNAASANLHCEILPKQSQGHKSIHVPHMVNNDKSRWKSNSNSISIFSLLFFLWFSAWLCFYYLNYFLQFIELLFCDRSSFKYWIIRNIIFVRYPLENDFICIDILLSIRNFLWTAKSKSSVSKPALPRIMCETLCNFLTKSLLTFFKNLFIFALKKEALKTEKLCNNLWKFA